MSAGALAKEERRRSRMLDHVDEQDEWFRNFGLGCDRMPVPQPSGVEEHRPHRVDYVFSPLVWYPRPEVIWSPVRLPSPPPVIPLDVSSASSSGDPRVVGGSLDVNPGQSTTLNGSALSAPSSDTKGVRKQVRHSVVQTDPPPKPRKPCNIKQKRRRRKEFEEGDESSRWLYHPFGKWPRPRVDTYPDCCVWAKVPGFHEVYCAPSRAEVWYRDRLKEELAVRSSAAPSVVVF